MSTLVNVEFTTTQPIGQGRARSPRCVTVDVTTVAARAASSIGLNAYTSAGRIQFAERILGAMGLRLDPTMAPVVTGKRGLANRGFRVMVWVLA